ncbi:bacillithiol biosynthesis cysteine-adding enzyme BshC [Leptobacterium flavescens]|uniref:Putative cysteine ligase BshC n=1 Tax=Leptobacterium flavescens TaxID=472055 RepID=A0A6P0UPG2_9FLAO|nr:bacillithiol biosynthesis cysteine-adding enzyme BshC [Leptobacterium flavescens]NER12246.1 bacillithiol biosynthesis cysteine-adding enzyme BshC [Leptobacterium flavescens]
MPTDCISFRETGYFSSLICDYLEQKEEIQPFYHRFPSLENLKEQIEEKRASFSGENRKVLVEALNKQYRKTEISEATEANISALNDQNTFTVTTGHQLNLFTGPLYFLYKIVSAINLSRKLKEAYPENNFVPVYWMATEDHDFDEISFFNFKGKKFQWSRSSGGAVGELSNEGLEEVFDLFSKQLGGGRNAEELRELFKAAYLEHDNLTEATRFLANSLFGEYGLVIVDGNDSALKRLFIPYVQKELEHQTSFSSIEPLAKELSAKGYKVQVNPREINLFYLSERLRERIVEQNGQYGVNDTDISFSKEEILKELDEHPERFSPNVMMRPLYQEVILPNLCYIGGGGELAYWLELKDYFKTVNVPFPTLLLRNSVLVATSKQKEKLEKLDLSYKNLFLKRDTFINRKVREISNIDIDFSPQKKHLEEQFAALYDLAEQTDKSFFGAVKAQEIKQLKGINNLEKRLLKAQKRKLSDHVSRITEIQDSLFPGQSLQERNLNFSELYLEHGKELISVLLDTLDPLKGEFLILEI